MNEELGRVYQDGEIIITEGEVGDCMYIIQQGTADVIRMEEGRPTVVDTMEAGELFGEMAIVENTVRSSTVKARGTVRAITIDRKTFMRRIQEDPSLAMSVLEVLCHRVRNLDGNIAHLKQQLESQRGGGV
ncbi:cyclic nucleotide-binding domain-containing protein [Seongchinamella unica]|uniref:cyclic nucleotide-binding domain-containing protein n=1 Tax=Seongchinamella unica TaxID=2547392 RepID=UPI001404C4C5|nr:cyclic nucleotide-binding domain-containing protein [Seongchinamella unica]